VKLHNAEKKKIFANGIGIPKYPLQYFKKGLTKFYENYFYKKCEKIAGSSKKVCKFTPFNF